MASLHFASYGVTRLSRATVLLLAIASVCHAQPSSADTGPASADAPVAAELRAPVTEPAQPATEATGAPSGTVVGAVVEPAAVPAAAPSGAAHSAVEPASRGAESAADVGAAETETGATAKDGKAASRASAGTAPRARRDAHRPLPALRPGLRSGARRAPPEEDPDRLRWLLPEEGWVALRISTGASIRAHHSMDLYTTDNSLLARGGGIGVDVWRHGSTLAVAVEADAGFEKASSAGLFGGDFDSWYTQYQGNVGASVRYRLHGLHPLLALVTPHLRVFGSYAGTKQRLTDNGIGISYQTKYERTFGGGVAAGVTLRTPSLEGFSGSPFPLASLGLRFEAGYGFMADPEFRLAPFDDSQHPIELHGASLGELQLNAAFLRTSLELRL